MSKQTSGAALPGDGALAFLAGGGEMGERIRAFDWASTSLGPIAQWPQSLKTSVRIMLSSRQPIWLGWGQELIKLYNDPYRAIVGGKHPQALGQPVSAVWRELWSEVGPMLEAVMSGGEATYVESQLFIMQRHGYPEETYYTFSYSPIPDDAGNPGGIFCTNTDDTQSIIGERQLSLLRELAASTVEARTTNEACRLAARALASNRRDLPFALIYLMDEATREARLAGASGIEAGTRAAPERVAPGEAGNWPFEEVLQARAPRVIALPKDQRGDLPSGDWPQAPHQAVVAPLLARGIEGQAALLVAGLNPFRMYDENYSRFIDLVSAQIASSIGNAQAYDAERRRAETLAEIDRAKTAFFSNVSHELRTPLTLMLGPIEEELREQPAGNARLELAHRNSLRLLKLVNTLLDFSRLEAGRMQSAYEPTDLAAVTAELASQFRSALEGAGLTLTIDCPALPEPVYVDREMWEKIVLNLLSNAFKFTFVGGVTVKLEQLGDRVQLAVSDTGTGISADELPRVFERFHRVAGARSRSYEGTGIGLALVQELVRLHGGDVSVSSEPGRGTTFTVRLPLGKVHLPQDRLVPMRASAASVDRAQVFLNEAGSWLAQDDAVEDRLPANEFRPGPRPRILLADDNSDMRDYVTRLLRTRFDVTAVADGEQALDAALAQRPDLVLSDVMMPGLDGFGLVRELRAHATTRGIPIILLSARAGEEARAEGVEQGADDYLVKPFSARELLARVQTHVDMARFRRETEQRVSEVLGSMLDGLHVVDAEGRFTLLNDAARQMFAARGLDADAMIGKRYIDIFPNAFETEAGRSLQQSLLEKKPLSIEHFYLPWRRWYQVRHFPIADGGVATFFQDITERKQAETALRDSEERYRTLFETHRDHARMLETLNRVGSMLSAELDTQKILQTVTDAATELSAAQFGAFFFNAIDDKGESYTLYTISGVPREAFSKFSLPRNTPIFEPTFKGTHIVRSDDIMKDRNYGTMEPHRGMPKGHLPVRSYLAVPVISRSGAVLGGLFFGHSGVGIFTEEAERLVSGLAAFASIALDNAQLYESVERQRQALAELDRRKDEFLAMLSHELRNPLAAISNATHVLGFSKSQDSQLLRARAIIERQVGQLARLVDDLLEVARITSGRIQLHLDAVDLNAVVQRAIESVMPTIERLKHRFMGALPTEPTWLHADATRIEQVVVNLLANAAKYTPDGGSIGLDLACEDGYAVLRISDTGVGITADNLQRIFEPFTQIDKSLERTQGGLGLGLSIVKRLVELHGGSVMALSRGVGLGSEFIVRLPLMPTGGMKAQGTVRAKGSEVQPRRILVVDDNVDSGDSLAIVLARMGHEVEVARDGLEAIAKDASFQADLILLDIGMPLLNGFETARRIRAVRNDGVMLVALSGWGRDEDRQRGLEAGFDRHLVKPVSADALVELLQELGAARA